MNYKLTSQYLKHTHLMAGSIRLSISFIILALIIIARVALALGGFIL